MLDELQAGLGQWAVDLYAQYGGDAGGGDAGGDASGDFSRDASGDFSRDVSGDACGSGGGGGGGNSGNGSGGVGQNSGQVGGQPASARLQTEVDKMAVLTRRMGQRLQSLQVQQLLWAGLCCKMRTRSAG